MQPNATLTTGTEVKTVVVETLGLNGRADAIDATTPLLGALPELDSLGAVELMLALENRFGITIDDEDVTAAAFETLGSLTALVESHLR
jgi:acyl carrier protein